MPPASNARKASAAAATTTAPITTSALPFTNDATSAPRRTTSGRAVRANTTRPANYYARPFGTFATAAGANSIDNDSDPNDLQPPGFFPALQFFSDAISALPREVIRHFTLMKEVEGKIYGPNEKLGEMADELMQYPVPSRRVAQHASVVDGQGLLSFTANNSAMGSASASLVNGNAPNVPTMSAQNSVSGSVNGEDTVLVASDDDLEKRRRFHELRVLTLNLLPNLDEKNIVLAETNRVLAQQLSRIDSVMPYVDGEMSEEARLGSMTHWAYSDNRQKKQAGGAFSNRRDVAATHSLAAAANAIHESDIAQARRDAVRETTREKHKGRARDHVDSDFEERPKKTQAKMAKTKAATHGAAAASNGEAVKKRKVDKGAAAVGMERTLSGMGKPVKSAKETPRSTPAEETVKKSTKAKPNPLPVKRKAADSAQESPALASSPLHSAFNPASAEPLNARPQSARLRQNSTATNLRHERLVDEEGGRPIAAPSRVNGEKTASKKTLPEDMDEPGEHERASKTTESEDNLKQEAEVVDNSHASRSTSNSGKAGRGSKTGTPKIDGLPEAPALVRTRSARNVRGSQDESSTEPKGGYRHKRNHSHLVKQLAPFNRSPDMNRVRHDDMDEDLDSVDGGQAERADDVETSHSPPKRQPRSRRNTGNLLAASSPPGYEHGEEDALMDDVQPEPAELGEAPDLEPESLPLDGDADLDEEEDEDSEPGDPDDPNEPKYCYCNRGSYGEMIACDNEQCPREWFHLGCTELKEPPDEAVKWYCEECKPLFVVKGRGKGRGAARK